MNKLRSKRLCIQTTVNHFPLSWLKPRANGRITVDQQLPSLLDVICCVRLHTLLHLVRSFCAKFKTGQILSQQLPTFLLQLRTLLRVVTSDCAPLRTRTQQLQQCWELLHPFAGSLTTCKPKRLQKGGASRSHRLSAVVDVNCTWAPTMVHL